MYVIRRLESGFLIARQAKSDAAILRLRATSAALIGRADQSVFPGRPGLDVVIIEPKHIVSIVLCCVPTCHPLDSSCWFSLCLRGPVR